MRSPAAAALIVACIACVPAPPVSEAEQAQWTRCLPHLVNSAECVGIDSDECLSRLRAHFEAERNDRATGLWVNGCPWSVIRGVEGAFHPMAANATTECPGGFTTGGLCCGSADDVGPPMRPCDESCIPPGTSCLSDSAAPVATAGQEAAGADDSCPGGRTTDGDCCATGRACGASCIAADQTCHVTMPPAPAYSPSSGGPVHVRGYYRRDGTYVAPYTRSRPRR